MSEAGDRLRDKAKVLSRRMSRRFPDIQGAHREGMAAALREGAKRLGHEPGWTNYECEDYLRALADELEGKS